MPVLSKIHDLEGQNLSVVPECLKCRAPVLDSGTPLKTIEGQLKCATHSTCVLACSNCGQNVEKGRCFVTKGCDKVYCTNCYRIEGQYAVCTICNGIIRKTELSMAFSGGINIHVECMACTICSKPLKKGQNMRFDQDFSMLFCEEHAKTQLVTPEIDDQVRLGRALVRDAPAFVGVLGPTGPASGETFGPTSLASRGAFGPPSIPAVSSITTAAPQEFLISSTTQSSGAAASQPSLQDRHNEANIQYTYRQKAILWSAFSQTTHPKPDEREFLAQQMGLPAETGARLVKIWFQNRRNNLISSTTQSSGATASQPRLQDRQNEANIQYTYLTYRQKAILWSAFSKTTHPKLEEREFFAKQMGLPAETGAKSVQIWFQNLRNLSLQPIMVNEDQIRLQHRKNETRLARTKYTAGQKVTLWRAYAQNKFPNKQMDEELVRKLGLPTETGVKSVQNWFKNRRSDAKKKKLEPIKSSPTTNQPQQVATSTNTPPQSVSPPEKLQGRGEVNLAATPTSQQIQGCSQVNWAAIATQQIQGRGLVNQAPTSQQLQRRGQVNLAATPPSRQIQGCGQVGFAAAFIPQQIHGRGQVNRAPTSQQIQRRGQVNLAAISTSKQLQGRGHHHPYHNVPVSRAPPSVRLAQQSIQFAATPMYHRRRAPQQLQEGGRVHIQYATTPTQEEERVQVHYAATTTHDEERVQAQYAATSTQEDGRVQTKEEGRFQAQYDAKTISLEETITLYRAPPSVGPPQQLQWFGQNSLAATPPTQSCPPSVSPNQQFEVQIHRVALTTTPPSSVSPPQGGQGFGSTNRGALTTTPPPLSVSPPQGGNGCGLTNQVATPQPTATYEGQAPQMTDASGESRLSPSWQPHLFEDFYLNFD